MSQTVEGRLAFRISLPSYAVVSVANDLSRLLERLSGGGFEITAIDCSVVTKEDVAATHE